MKVLWCLLLPLLMYYIWCVCVHIPFGAARCFIDSWSSCFHPPVSLLLEFSAVTVIFLSKGYECLDVETILQNSVVLGYNLNIQLYAVCYFEDCRKHIDNFSGMSG